MGDGTARPAGIDARTSVGTVRRGGHGELHYRAWRAERAEGRVLVVHGLGDHSGRFAAFGGWLAEHGIEAAAVDLRGHGRSGGRRGHAGSFADLLGDVEGLRRRLVEERGELPTVLFGHSLGGLVVLRYLQEGAASEVRGAVAAAPFLRLEMRPPDWKLALGTIADRWLPALTLSSGTDTDLVLREDEERRERRSDPRVHDRISARLWGEMQRAAREVLERPDRVDAPVLLQVAGDDQVVSSAAVAELGERMGRAGEVRRYPGAYHDLLHDPRGPEAASDALDWIRDRVDADPRRGPETAYRLHPDEARGGPRPGAAEARANRAHPGEEPMEDREPVADDEQERDEGAAPSEGPAAGEDAADRAAAEEGDPAPGDLEELEEIRDRHLRLAAEYENYRKRTRREMAEARERAQAQLAGRLLDALDDLDRFVASSEEETDPESLREGVELVRRKLWKELSEAGLERMEAEGERFDPEVHDALLTTPVDDPDEDGLVSRVLIAGYLFGDRVLRPARVEVKRHVGDEAGDSPAGGDGGTEGESGGDEPS